MVIGRITQQECNSFANVETPQRCHLSHGNGRIYRAAHHNYPDVRARIEQHINETKRQITLLEEILDRNDISRSVLKDSMSKMAALGQSIGGMFPSDEIVKGSISGYVFEQFEIACYTSLLAAAKKAGDTASVPAIETILAEEREMADWLIRHIPQTTEQFLLRSDADGVEAKK